MHKDLKSDDPKNQNIDILPMLDASFDTSISMDENSKPDNRSYDLAEELMHRQELQRRQDFGELYRKTVKTEDDKKLYDQVLQQYAGEPSYDPSTLALVTVMFEQLARKMAEDRKELNKKFFHFMVGSASGALIFRIARYYEITTLSKQQEVVISMLIGAAIGLSTYHLSNYLKRNTQPQEQKKMLAMTRANVANGKKMLSNPGM